MSPRTLRSFVSGWWSGGLAAASILAVALTVAMGIPSRRDDEGRYTQLWLELGTNGARAANGIYGWYYSVPALIMMAVLLVATAIAWRSIPRPAWGADPEWDTALRRLRAANIGRAALGALLIHLGDILRQLWALTGTRAEVTASPLGTVSIPSPLGALEPVLAWSWPVAEGLGLALWILVALTGISSPSRRGAYVAGPAR